MTEKIKATSVGQKVRIIGGTQADPSQHNFFKKGDVVEVTLTCFTEDTIEAKGTVHRPGNYSEAGTQYVRHSDYEVIPDIDFTQPLRTKSGSKVTLLTTAARGEFPIIAYLGDGTAQYTYTKDGMYYVDGKASPYDLENVPPEPEKRVVYVNVYKNDNGLRSAGSHASRGEANASATSSRVGCIKVVLVEGQYDE